MKRYLVDADAFIALIRQDDSNHQKALAVIERFKSDTQYLTSNYVFSEVVTVLSLRVGKSAALAFIDTIHLETSPYTILPVDAALEKDAVAVFKAQASKNVSFVNCINIALVRAHQLDGIFSFDKVYKKNGLPTIPG